MPAQYSHAPRRATQHIVAVVQDRPGTLNRIVSVFRRRSLNIQRLIVEPVTDDGSEANTSRMSFAVEMADATRCIAELRKMVGVLDLTVELPHQSPATHPSDNTADVNDERWYRSIPQADGAS
jgi:glycine cleavage system regulatory protein